MSPHLFPQLISLLLPLSPPLPSVSAVLSHRAWRRWISSSLQLGQACNEAFVFVLWTDAVSKLNWMFSPRLVPFYLPAPNTACAFSIISHIPCYNASHCSHQYTGIFFFNTYKLSAHTRVCSCGFIIYNTYTHACTESALWPYLLILHYSILINLSNHSHVATTAKLEDPSSTLKSAVWENFGVDHDDGLRTHQS